MLVNKYPLKILWRKAHIKILLTIQSIIENFLTYAAGNAVLPNAFL